MNILGLISQLIGIKTLRLTRTIKVFQSDNAQEYHDKSFLSILDSNGTLPHYSCPYTSKKNGRAERKLRHILNVMVPFSYLPLSQSVFGVKWLSLPFTL